MFRKVSPAQLAQAKRDLKAWRKKPIRLRRMLLKPIVPPAGIEAKYISYLRREHRRLELEINLAIKPILELFKDRDAARIKEDSLRQDAPKFNLNYIAPRMKAGVPVLFESTISRLRRTLKARADVNIVKGVFSDVDNAANEALKAQAALLTSVPFFVGTTDSQKELLAAAVKDNVSLIKTIPESMLDRVQATLIDGWANEKRSSELAEDLQDQFGVTERQAVRIARTEVTKVNSQIVEARSTEAGAETYTWRTAGDGKVRKRHRELDGTVQRFDDPPRISEDGQPAVYGGPGEVWNCRCNRIVNVEDVFDRWVAEHE